MHTSPEFIHNFIHNLYYQEHLYFEHLTQEEKCIELTTRYIAEWMFLIDNYLRSLERSDAEIEMFRTWYYNRTEYTATQIVILVAHIHFFNDTIDNYVNKYKAYRKLLNELLNDDEYKNIQPLPSRFVKVIQTMRL